MPSQIDFPHLNLAYQGSFEPKFRGGSGKNQAVIEIRNNPEAHVDRIRGVLAKIREDDAAIRQQRQGAGLPPIPADKCFLLKLPEGTDVEYITKALGVELVAESDEGLMLVSSEDIDFAKLKQVLTEFKVGRRPEVGGRIICL